MKWAIEGLRWIHHLSPSVLGILGVTPIEALAHEYNDWYPYTPAGPGQHWCDANRGRGTRAGVVALVVLIVALGYGTSEPVFASPLMRAMHSSIQKQEARDETPSTKCASSARTRGCYVRRTCQRRSFERNGQAETVRRLRRCLTAFGNQDEGGSQGLYEERGDLVT